MKKVSKKNLHPLCASFALTFRAPSDWGKVLEKIQGQDYFDFGVWTEEVGETGYAHVHFNVVYTVKRRLNNKFWDDILGVHPHVQPVGENPNDSRRLWQYYCKQATPQVIAKTRDEETLLSQVLEEVSLGLEFGEKLTRPLFLARPKHRSAQRSDRDHSPERPGAKVIPDLEPRTMTDAQLADITQQILKSVRDETSLHFLNNK